MKMEEKMGSKLMGKTNLVIMVSGFLQVHPVHRLLQFLNGINTRAVECKWKFWGFLERLTKVKWGRHLNKNKK